MPKDVIDMIHEMHRMIYEMDKRQALLLQAFEQHQQEARQRDARIASLEECVKSVTWVKQTGSVALWLLAALGSVTGVAQFFVK